jgi:hypothetical protein
MKSAKRILATMALAGGLAAGAVGAGTGVANADPGYWHGDGHHGRGWDGPRWDNRGYGDPIPGGWNGGWEPWGGVCVFGACI